MAYYLAKGGIKVPIRLRLRSYNRRVPLFLSFASDIGAVVLLL